MILEPRWTFYGFLNIETFKEYSGENQGDIVKCSDRDWRIVTYSNKDENVVCMEKICVGDIYIVEDWYFNSAFKEIKKLNYIDFQRGTVECKQVEFVGI